MLRNRSLAALLVAEVVSTTGSAMTFLALPWFVLVTTGSPSRMSIVLAAELVPVALFGIPSGSVVNALGARRTMLLSDLVRAPLIALVPALYWWAHLPFAGLVAIVVVSGIFIAPYMAAQRSIVPELLGTDETAVAKASGLFGGATQLCIVIGPAVGGVLIAWLGAPAVLVVDAATFLAAFTIVGLLVAAGAPVPADESSRGILAGVRYLARDPLLGPVTLTVIVIDLGVNAVVVAVPLLAFERFDRNAHLAGWLFAGFGAGAVAGSVVVVRLLDHVRPMRLAAGTILLLAAPVWALVADLPAWGVALAMVAIGLVVPCVNAPLMGVITARPPAALRAKVMTAVLTASALGAPLGRVAVGPLYQRSGAAGTFAATATVITVGALLFIAATLRHEVVGDEPLPV
jgi:predicted MFS family arabinose efflux permease